jgi:hypothetical protein
MPWGKYKGEEIEDIESDYLHWLAANANDDVIATVADEEWRRREDAGEHFYE